MSVTTGNQPVTCLTSPVDRVPLGVAQLTSPTTHALPSATMSLADELGDELDAQMSISDHPGAGANLGQSLADELDLDFELDHGLPLGSPGIHTHTSRSQDLRDDGLPLPPTTSGSTPRRTKTSNTSTYYTATTSPGQFSNIDCIDAVEQDLEESSEAPSTPPTPKHLRSSDQGVDMTFNDAGLLTPAMGEDLMQILQEQVDEQVQFRDLLRSTISKSAAPLAVSHSLNRSTRPYVNGEDEMLGHHISQMDEAVKSSQRHTQDLIKLRKDLEGLSPLQIKPEMVKDMLVVLDDMITPSTPTSTEVMTPAESPSTPTAAYESSHIEFPFVRANESSPSHAIPNAVNAVIYANKDIITDCSTLIEVADSHQTVLNATARHIKGLKATVASFRERDAAEEHARRVIESWERSQVERGLRGESSTKDILDELVGGLEEVVRDCDLRMARMRSSEVSDVAA